MNKKRRNLPSSDAEAKPIVISSRRSKHGIVIPVLRHGLDAEAIELERLKRKWKGTTPLGREIIRKLVMRARRKLFGSE